MAKITMMWFPHSKKKKILKTIPNPKLLSKYKSKIIGTK
jgi:hypothetical protein